MFTKIVSTTFLNFNSIVASLFVGGYFILFLLTIILILKKRMLSLVVKGDILHIKSFPTLNEKIPVSQVLKCELNTMKEEQFELSGKIRFALNEEGNRYKLPLSSGIALQLTNGSHIIIGSHKS